jgi:ATP-dependent DNA helicase RecQ
MKPQELLQQYFGFSDFRPGQREVMSALWKHKAALAVFPTGGGKSLCYQLPALMFEGVTLVVSPLIALMKDQIDFLQSRGVAAARLDSSLSTAEAFSVNDRLRSGELKLLYVAPERFNNERFLERLKQAKIALFAVDEAHCISEWGHNFRPDYLKLAEAARDVGAERVLALTATATPAVVDDICEGFDIPPDCAIVTGFYRPNLTMLTTPVASGDRDGLLLERLHSRDPGPTIVYVTLQKTAERVAENLSAAGLPARPYHAGMEADQRTAVQEWWMASGNGIVVATIAFGMGIDKADVRYVYHYNLPKGLESYSQEIGRAGRDGNPSTVEMLACPDDVPTLENFAFGDTPTETALRGLVEEVLQTGRRGDGERGSKSLNTNTEHPTPNTDFDVSLYELSDRHDIRQLVLRTALTYLELLGVLRQGTPFYAGYAIRPLIPLEQILGQLSGEPGRFVAAIFDNTQKGKTKNSVWHRLNPDEAAAATGSERKRVVRALEVLEERGLIELTVADVRNRYTLLEPEAEAETLTEELVSRFHRREEQEVARIEQVLSLVTHPGCQVNALVSYFGEERAEPCGHCTFCLTGSPQGLPPERPRPAIGQVVNADDVKQLRSSHPEALGEPRQVARFLCGLTSPALTKAKLSRHELFGRLEEHRFGDVLAWVRAEE